MLMAKSFIRTVPVHGVGRLTLLGEGVSLASLAGSLSQSPMSDFRQFPLPECGLALVTCA